jgi:hypothetical protein
VPFTALDGVDAPDEVDVVAVWEVGRESLAGAGPSMKWM